MWIYLRYSAIIFDDLRTNFALGKYKRKLIPIFWSTFLTVYSSNITSFSYINHSITYAGLNHQHNYVQLSVRLPSIASFHLFHYIIFARLFSISPSYLFSERPSPSRSNVWNGTKTHWKQPNDAGTRLICCKCVDLENTSALKTSPHQMLEYENVSGYGSFWDTFK